jgi:hypothetical protein
MNRHMKAISTRRDFLRSFAILGGALVASRGVMACVANPRGSENTAAGQSDDELVECAPPTISANHGHKLVVSSADVAAGVAKTYSIQGAASHDHEVTISATQFAQLALGGSITMVSTTTLGHTHNVTVTCATTHDADAGSDATANTDADADAAAADASVANADADAAVDSPICPDGADASSISNNHGHTLFVSHDDVIRADSKSYSIQGMASHAHNVTISSAQFATLRSGDTITVPSTTTLGHSHSVTVICV